MIPADKDEPSRIAPAALTATRRGERATPAPFMYALTCNTQPTVTSCTLQPTGKAELMLISITHRDSARPNTGLRPANGMLLPAPYRLGECRSDLHAWSGVVVRSLSRRVMAQAHTPHLKDY